MNAPKLSLVAADAETVAADALVIGVTQGADGPVLAPGAGSVDTVFDGRLTEILGTLGATGKADEITRIPARTAAADVLVAVGLGKVDGSPTPEQVRRACGAAARALAGTRTVATTLAEIDLAGAVEGTLLGRYVFTDYKTDKGKAPIAEITLVLPASADPKNKHIKAVLKHSTLVAEAVISTRDLVNTPPNDLFPASFAGRAAKLGEAAGMTVEVLDEKALRKAGFGGVLGVGQGSSRPPRLVRLSYQGPKARVKVALVGKGVTFDTGGISIKPAPNMEEMTSDMAGAAAVVATAVLAAKLKLPLDLSVFVPMVENMPSGTSYRPGDVLTMYGGKTVEVQNTDAEGRLILADAIVRACEDKPDYLIETSTLTGAQLVALGKRYAAVMGSEELRNRVAAVSEATGERVWPMPLPEELRADFDSNLADLRNITGHRWGGMCAAGLFLREFVTEGVAWAHLDIAGPAYHTSAPYGYTGTGGTGVPVRTLIALLEDIATNG